MQEVKNRLSIVEKNIEKLVRKLTELRDINEKLLVENNLLKKEKADLVSTIENYKNNSSSNGVENVEHVKAEIETCMQELESCIELVENNIK